MKTVENKKNGGKGTQRNKLLKKGKEFAKKLGSMAYIEAKDELGHPRKSRKHIFGQERLQ